MKQPIKVTTAVMQANKMVGEIDWQAKEDPRKIYIFEIYADQEAYQSHIQTAHFKKYKEGTAKMVKSLKLVDVNPLAGMIK